MRQISILITLLALSLFACKGLYQEAFIKIEPDYVEVHFERMMPQAVLDKLKTDLATQNIVLEYVDVKYDGDKLNFLSFTVTYQGRVGVGTTYFVHKHPYGFIVDNRAGKPARFVVGEILE